MTKEDKTSAISTFFNAKSVFITGATGFIGKQIVEKLLRSCPGVDHIYVLIRTKRGVHADERIKKLCSLPLFDKVRLLTPTFESKLIPISGDLSKANLDLTNENELILIEKCHVIINSAASVRFDEPLKQALQSNVYSAQNMINLCKKMKQLQSFVHISTAYIHCYRTDIHEVIYPMNESPSVLLESLEHFNDEMFDHFAEKLTKQYPNTYTYTKSLAECLILQQANNLPIAIVRPSIVGAAWKEPIAGWVDNYSGATGILVAAGKCLLRTGMGNKKVDLPVVPVDAVANMTVAVAWHTAINSDSLSTPVIYNCATGTKNKTCLPLGEFFQIMAREQISIGFHDYSIIEPTIALTLNRPYYHVQRFMSELLPACLLDIIACLTFRKAKMVKLCEKVKNLKIMMHYFTQHQWLFTDRNSQLLLTQLNDIDRQEFDFDLTELNMPSYIRNYCIGVKKYLLKEDLSHSSAKPSSKHAFVKAKGIRRLLSILFFFGMTWIIRQVFLKRLRVVWKTLNLIIRSFLQRDNKTFLYSLSLQ